MRAKAAPNSANVCSRRMTTIERDVCISQSRMLRALVVGEDNEQLKVLALGNTCHTTASRNSIKCLLVCNDNSNARKLRWKWQLNIVSRWRWMMEGARNHPEFGMIQSCCSA